MAAIAGAPTAKGASEHTQVMPRDLQCEHLTNPLGIDVAAPRYSWHLVDKADVRGQKQTGYQVLVASKKSWLSRNRGDVWDSGKVSSSQSTLVSYGGAKLTSDQNCYWKVRVFDKDGRPSEWSPVARFAMGLLSPAEWKGSWIKHPDAPAEKHLWFRKDLILEKGASSAFIHVASVGYHELFVNGKKVDDRVLAPVLTRLDQRVLYVTYDLVPLLQAGKNTIALWTGPGWARYKFFNTHPALRVQLNGQTTDGRSFSLASDTTWRTEISSSFSQNLGGYKGGETIDARRDVADWNAADFDDSHWPLAANTSMEVTLSAQMLEPTRIIETIKPKSISQIRSGTNLSLIHI